LTSNIFKTPVLPYPAVFVLQDDHISRYNLTRQRDVLSVCLHHALKAGSIAGLLNVERRDHGADLLEQPGEDEEIVVRICEAQLRNCF